MTGAGVRLLVASDLDRTLIYSRTALTLSGPAPLPELVCVESTETGPASFMTADAATLLAEVTDRVVFVPTTTRSVKQLERLNLPATSRYSIAANGAVLLVDGAPDRDWEAQVGRAVADAAPLAQVWAQLGRACRPQWTRKLRQVADRFCYAQLDRAGAPADLAQEVSQWARPAGWSVSLQGRKLYLVPAALTKSATVAEVARRVDAGRVVAAGDSLLDRDLLEFADAAVRPGHGELAEQSWSRPHVHALASRGVFAGADIVSWFATQADQSAAGPAL